MSSSLVGVGWSFDSNSPQRDTSVSVEDEMEAYFGKPQLLPWRHKHVRLWRFVTGYHPRQRRDAQ